MMKMGWILGLIVIGIQCHASELKLRDAEHMAAAAEAKAKQLGVVVSFAILDQSGLEKLFFRMDGASAGSIQIAKLKANTSASYRVSSRQLANANLNQPNRAYSFFPGVILLPGGLPIRFGDAFLGGVGVSGATGDQDEQIAQAALDALCS